MKPNTQRNAGLRLARLTLLALAVATGAAWAQQKPPAKGGAKAPEAARIFMAINEGGAANADASETLFQLGVGQGLQFLRLQRVPRFFDQPEIPGD